MVIASAVLSLFNSSSMELSDEKASVKFLDCTIGNSSSYHKEHSKYRKSRKLGDGNGNGPMTMSHHKGQASNLLKHFLYFVLLFLSGRP